jgi:hypothetical protein
MIWHKKTRDGREEKKKNEILEIHQMVVSSKDVKHTHLSASHHQL